MKLSFTGSPEVAAPLAHVWPRLMDPHFVAKHGPGVESVEVLDPHHFKVICGFGVGSIKLRFGLDVELFDVNPPNYFAMKVRGKAPGSAVEVGAQLSLETIDAQRSRMNWKAESDINGTVASVGARLMEGTARKLTEQFWSRFAASIAEAGPPPETEAAGPAPPAPAPAAAPPPSPAQGTEPAPGT